ncbi:MAG: hypothetical protein QXD13_02050, partial [Candidatus Pacearchaeota archaeon]
MNNLTNVTKKCLWKKVLEDDFKCKEKDRITFVDKNSDNLKCFNCDGYNCAYSVSRYVPSKKE